MIMNPTARSYWTFAKGLTLLAATMSLAAPLLNGEETKKTAEPEVRKAEEPKKSGGANPKDGTVLKRRLEELREMRNHYFRERGFPPSGPKDLAGGAIVSPPGGKWARASAPENKATKGGGTDEMVTLDYMNVPMPDILKLYGELIGEEVILDINLNSMTFTLQSRRPMPKDDAIEFIERSLALNGYPISPEGEKFVKCVFAPPPVLVPSVLVIRVTDKGVIVKVGDEKIPRAGLPVRLSEILLEHRNDKVMIEADGDVPFKDVVDVTEMVKANGVKDYSIQTGRSGR